MKPIINEEKCIIEKRIQHLDSEGTVVMEQSLFIKGESLKEVKQIFRELWEK